MAASSSSAAADSRPPKYDVFISFRGETRNSFTSHLYSELRKKQINAYIDEKSLEKGDDISPALLKAIEESTISIIIFSEDYASSRWCLDELVHILKCREEKGQTVLPIFHGIDPSHIRKQEGTYAAAFVKHQERFKDKMDKVQEWRQALTRAADLSGWNSKGKSESVLVQQVVEDVISKLQSISSTSIDDLKGFFGIQRQLCEIESLLCFDSPNVRILGIWGMGGIGKTTLAGVVFKRFSNRFEGACFLRNVRAETNKNRLDELEKEVFSKLLREKDPDVYNPFVNIRLSRTKSLLVLDDVDDFEQLQRLVGDRDRFGPGSKIILTSRDFQVLNESIDELYEVQALDLKNEASQLFYLKAFGKNSCRPEYEEISAKAVSYTGGNPLALQVLGSYLKSLGIKEWESALEKLRITPHVKIQKVLRISYDGLDPVEQDIFLDIACFLKDEKKDFVEGILKHKSIIAITVLVHKSLITIDQDGLIHMHDLIQEMGRNIVHQLTKKLGERSRLWISQDVSYVLNKNIGTEAIEGIYLPWIEEELRLRPDVFEDMYRLRLLKIHPFHCKVYINGALEYLPDSLTYLDWEDYPAISWPLNFNTENLVELHMPRSNLRQLWDGIQHCKSLKLINLQFSKHLTKIPDLSLAPKLESINLSHCRSLNNIPSLNIQATSYESAFRPFGTERTPGYVSFRCCRRLRTLPKVSGNITVLILFDSGLKELPSSIEFLENLVHLDLRYCKRLKSLPTLPRNIEKLHLEYSGIEQIPSSSIECLCNLRVLSLNNCKSLESLPSIIWKLKTLEELDLSGCLKLSNLPEISNQSGHLCCLYLSDTSIQELPSSIENLIGLRHLSLRSCKYLKFIPETLGKLTRLQKLSLPGCSRLENLPSNIWKLKALEEIDLSECTKLRNLPEISNHLEHLWKLNLARTSIQELPSSIENLIELCDLSLEWCEHLQLIPSSIGNLYRLKSLNISYCENLQSLPELPLFIKYLNARQCSSLEMVSTSRSTHTLEHWLDKYDISFVDCSKLGENAIGTIFKEFIYKVFCSAATPQEVVTSKGMTPQAVVCYPGHEIPKWFNNQCEGSLTIVRLPPNWYNPHTFLGFVASVVANEDVDEKDFSIVECELHLMTRKGRFRVDVFEYTVKSCSDHMVMWYNYFDRSKANFEKFQDASLELKSRFKVKWCGVRMLYSKDANF